MSFHRIVKTTARKEHLCSLCGVPVEKKERYVREDIFIEGKGYRTWAFHLTCATNLNAYRDVKGGSWTPEQVIEWLGRKYCQHCSKRDECRLPVLKCELVQEYTKKRCEKERRKDDKEVSGENA